MPEHENVYRHESERYHALVSFEDYQHNLTSGIQEIIPRGSTILESGAGTGRVSGILSPISRSLVSFDLSVPMLSFARQVTGPSLAGFKGYASADHRALPVKREQFKWIVAGWSVCYLVSWERTSWKQEVELALREFMRVLEEDGNILIIETLGTGKISPEPPPHLTDYLSYLEEIGFQRRWLRSDYKFPNASTARELTRFFFGSEMLPCISRDAQPVLPECTGLWVCPKLILKKNLPG